MPSEQTQAIYDKLFKSGTISINMFLKNLMNLLFKKQLNFKKIDNEFYMSRSLKIVYAEIAKELNSDFSLKSEHLKSVASYIVKKHFNKIYELMAIELLKQINKRDANAIKFLLYYDGSSVLINSKKYKKPLLKTDNGKKWCNAGMPAICDRWVKERMKMITDDNMTEKEDPILNSVVEVLSSKLS